MDILPSERGGQGQDRTVDLPLFRGPIASFATLDRQPRQPCSARIMAGQSLRKPF